jgi:hypothetical protein
MTRGEAAGFAGVLNEVTIAQLGQDGFKRSAKAVENPDRIFKRSKPRDVD